MHPNPTGSPFIVYSKKYSTKLITKPFSNAFKSIFHQVQNFYDKSCFYSSFKYLWVIENSKPVFEKKNEKINCIANTKPILTFDFATL